MYVGDGIKFTDKLRPFPLAPPVLNEDPGEYGEFVLPEVKVLTPEEIKQKVDESFDEAYGKVDGDGAGAISADDAKKVFAELKAKVNGQEEPAEVNEEAVDEILEGAEKNEDDKIAKEAVQALWSECRSYLIGGGLDQLVMDELGLAVALGYLDEQEVRSTLEQRPGSMDVIVTGLSIPDSLMDMADQVTELRRGF